MMKEDNKIGVDAIEEALVNLKKPSLSESENYQLKNRVFARLNEAPVKEDFGYFSTLVRAISRIVAGFALESGRKACVKENVFALIETRLQKSFFWPKFFAFSSKVVSLVLVCAIGFTSFIFMNTKPFVVRAASFTALDDFEGNVLIQRGELLLPAKKGMVLKEKDSLLTAEDSFAEVKYFDDSVSRLSENTRVKIDRLDAKDTNSVSTYVEISLEHGTLWSKVVNLFEANSAFVVKASDVYAKTQRGAFNFVFAEGNLNIGVFSDVVEVEKGGNVDQLVSGEKLVFHGGSQLLQKQEIPMSEKNQEWVKKNLESDERYLTEVERRLIAAKLEAIGVDAADEVSFEKSLAENVTLFLTFDQIDRQKLELDLAERNFLTAQLKLQRANLTEEEKIASQGAIDDFVIKTKAFYDLLADVRLTDEDYARELKSYVDNKIIAQKKDLSLTLPGSPAYGARVVVEDLELLSATDQKGFLEIKKKQANEKIAVVKDVIDKGDYDLAVNVLKGYTDDVNSVISMIDSTGTNNDSQIKDRFVQEVQADLKLLDVAVGLNSPAIKEAKSDLIEVAKNAGITPIIPTVVPVVVTPKNPGDVTAAALVELDNTVLGEVPVAVEPVVTDVPEVIEGPYGVKIKGDKPLDPLLSP